jgi:outer membrane protein OmpA-like peptidoglycan-associated protein
MLFKLLREHLPWFAPTAAIVFAASGYWERPLSLGGSSEPTQASLGTAFLTPNSVPVTAPASAPQTVAAPELVTRQETFTPAFDVNQAGALGASTQAAVAAVQPTPEPLVAPQIVTQPRTASLEQNPAAFFKDAQANLTSSNSCKDDLRFLASQARVYFTSGGLNADENGIEQARLIGVVAHNCPGVRIQVEGHSDPSGDPGANLRLSQLRAEQVIQRIGASGADTSLFVARGFGDRRPSGLVGPNSRAYYDRRVEFSVIDVETPATFGAARNQFIAPGCVADLQAAVAETKLFYAPRSIAVPQRDFEAVVNLANKAVACPQARLRVIGQHTDEAWAGEDVNTGILRAKTVMAMLVGRGIDSGEVIIAAPSYSVGIQGQPDASRSRIDFDVIIEN